MCFAEGTEALAESAGRVLGTVMNKMKVCPDLSFSTFSKLYDQWLAQCLFHAAGVWA